jgi:hypothetical protein
VNLEIYKYRAALQKQMWNLRKEYEDTMIPCGCPSTWEPSTLPYGCTLNQPLFMVIPPEGIHLDCPVHRLGHHIRGKRVVC